MIGMWLALSPDRQRFAVTHEGRNGGGTIAIGDLQTGKLTYLSDPADHRSTAIAWSPDGRRLAAKPPQQARPVIFDTTSGERLLELRGGEDVERLAFTPDGR